MRSGYRQRPGKKHVIKTRDNDTLYNYYSIGDRVRHHAGLKCYEKHDKTGDKFIPCAACATFCDISGDRCFRCKCPLLKRRTTEATTTRRRMPYMKGEFDMKMGTLTRSAGAFLLMAVLLTGCGETQGQPSADPGSAAGQITKVYRLGETGKTDELEITVTKAQRAKEWTKTPKEGLEYVVVFIRAKNISGEEQSITGNQFGFVMDEAGNRGSYETYTGVPVDLGYSGTMAPGESVEINLVYAMPADMSRIEFHYTEGYAPEPTLRFEFNK